MQPAVLDYLLLNGKVRRQKGWVRWELEKDTILVYH
jgi:hypothetical protein